MGTKIKSIWASFNNRVFTTCAFQNVVIVFINPVEPIASHAHGVVLDPT
jgi:hypothetical protein